MSENKLSEDLLLDADAFDGQSFMMTAGEMRTYSERATVLESELSLLRKAVRQLGIERPRLAALVVALDSETILDVLSEDAQAAFRLAIGTAEPDPDVLDLIKESESK